MIRRIPTQRRVMPRALTVACIVVLALIAGWWLQ